MDQEPHHQAQEDVWDYPRPPRVEATPERVQVFLGGKLIAETTAAVRVLETSHPPVYYLPLEDFVRGALIPVDGTTFCEFKGQASYFDISTGPVRAEQAERAVRAERAAWTYSDPAPGYGQLAGRAAVYPGRVDRCTVDGEEVLPQEGDFYGGWITARVSGPFKGAAGTGWW